MKVLSSSADAGMWCRCHATRNLRSGTESAQKPKPAFVKSYDVSNLFAESKIIMNHCWRWIRHHSIPVLTTPILGGVPRLAHAICKVQPAAAQFDSASCPHDHELRLYPEILPGFFENLRLVQTSALVAHCAVLA